MLAKILKVSFFICFFGLSGCHHFSSDKPAKAPEVAAGLSGKELFEVHCQVCHSLALPEKQRLSRQNWEWVVDDMVNKYGMNWVSPSDQKKIVDHLAANFKPKKRRKIY